MIFSDSEREHYRRELEAASDAGDLKRVKRLIDQIRLLGEIREPAPKIQINLRGVEEYIKHQSMIKKEEDREDKPLTTNGLLNYIENMEPPKVFPNWPEITGYRLPPKSFRDVLRLGFNESGWTW